MTRLLAFVAACAALLAVSTTAVAAPQDSRTAFWRLDETSGMTAADTAPPPNPVKNGSFESDTSNWVSGPTGFLAGSSTLTQVADSGAPDGSKVGKVVTPATASAGIGTDVNVTAGYSYTVHVKLRRDSGSDLRVALGEVNSPNQELVVTNSAAPNTSDYTEYTGVVTPARSGTYRLYVRTKDAVATTFYVDAVSMREATGLVGNPSFETDASGWVSNAGSFLGANSTLSRVTDGAAPDGAYVGKVVTPAAAQAGIGTDVTVTAGRRYTVTVKLREDTGGSTLRVALGQLASPAQELVVTNNASPGSTGYTTYSGVLTPSGSGTYRLYVRTTSATLTTFYVDDVSVVQEPEIVPNPSFEAGTSNWVSGPTGFLAGSSTLTQVADSGAPDGSKVGKVVTPATASAGIGTDVNVTGGRSYTVRVKLRRDSGSDLRVALGEVNSPNQELVVTNSAAPTASGYTEYTGVVTPARTGTYRLYVRTKDAVTTTFYVDAVSLQEVTGLVGNPSFEGDTSGWVSSAGAFLAADSTLTQVADSGAPDGSKVGKVVTPATASSGIGTDVLLTGGRRYTVRVKLRRDSGSDLRVALGEMSSPNEELVVTNSATPGASGYTEYSGVVSPSRTGTYRLYVRTKSATTTTFYVDDVQLLEGFAGEYTGSVSLNQTGATRDGDAAVLLNGGRITTNYSPFASSSTRTFEGWAKRSSSTSTDVLVGGDDASLGPSLSVESGGNDMSFTPRNGVAAYTWQGAAPGLDHWFYWALVYDDAAKVARLYVNGIDLGASTAFANGYSSPGNLELGARQGSSGPFDGYLDDVAVYNRALTPTEVEQVEGAGFKCDEVLPSSGISTPGELDDALTSGETGCFRAGTYQQTNIDLTTPGATFRPYPGEDATWRGRMVIAADDFTIRGLTLDGSYGPVCADDSKCLADDQAADPADRCFDVNKCTFSTPVVHGKEATLFENDISNRRPGDTERAGICVNESNSGDDVNGYLIARNRIHDCGQLSSSTGLPRNHDHGIYVGSGVADNGGEIRDNVIFDNADRGIQLYPNAAHVTIVNNTIDGNGEGVSIGGKTTDSGDLVSHDNTVDKNVITNSTVRWNLEAPGPDGTGNSVTNTCLLASNANSYYNQDNGIEASPPFRNVVSVGTVVQAPSSVYVNRGAKDFRLSAGTCRDNGWGAPDAVAAP